MYLFSLLNRPSGRVLYSWSRMPLSRPCLLRLISAPAGLLLTLDSFSSTDTAVLALTPVPGMGPIHTRFRCSAVVSFISDVSACCAAIFLLVALCFRLGGVRADRVRSELAAMFLSLRSIYLTPNPKFLIFHTEYLSEHFCCGIAKTSFNRYSISYPEPDSTHGVSWAIDTQNIERQDIPTLTLYTYHNLSLPSILYISISTFHIT